MTKFLIEFGANPNVENDDGDKALHIAVKNGMHAWLYKKNFQTEAIFWLWFASLPGNVDITRIFINHNADINARNKNGETPLDVELKKGKLLLHSYHNLYNNSWQKIIL